VRPRRQARRSLRSAYVQARLERENVNTREETKSSLIVLIGKQNSETFQRRKSSRREPFEVKRQPVHSRWRYGSAGTTIRLEDLFRMTQTGRQGPILKKTQGGPLQ